MISVFQTLKTYFVDTLVLMFSWLPAPVAIVLIFLFAVACILIYIKMIVTILKMIPFF